MNIADKVESHRIQLANLKRRLAEIRRTGGGGTGELNDGCLFGHRLSGQYYTSQITCLSGSPRAAQTKDNMRACPFLVSKSQAFDRIGTNVTGVVDAKLRLGIYDSTVAGYPDNLILDSGELDSSVTGDVEAIINETLPVGLYWLVHLGSKDQSIRSLINDMVIAVMGFDDMGNTQPSLSWHVAQAYGALPDPFTGGGTTKEWSAAVAVYLRKS